MKTILTAILLLIGVTCHAQVTPQYYIDSYPNGVVAPIFNYNAYRDTFAVQSLLRLDSFTTSKPPYGKVKNLYIRTGGAGSTWSGCKATKVKLSMGHTNLQNLDTVTKSFVGLTVIAEVDTLTNDTIKGSWIKIPVKPEVSFFIDTMKNLLFELTLDTGGLMRVGGGPQGCTYLASMFKGNVSVKYLLLSNKKGNTIAQKYNVFANIGFDLYPNPAQIKSEINITDLRIYPNPSGGSFIISMAAERVVKEATLSVTDMAGRVVWQQQYQNIDENFYQNIDISAYPQGIYLAELRADGERLTRKLVVQ